MKTLDIPKSVRNIRILTSDGPLDIYKKRKKGKKKRDLLKPMARYMRAAAAAEKARAEELDRRTRKSSDRKKSRVVFDYDKNVARARAKGEKVFRKKMG